MAGLKMLNRGILNHRDLVNTRNVAKMSWERHELLYLFYGLGRVLILF